MLGLLKQGWILTRTIGLKLMIILALTVKVATLLLSPVNSLVSMFSTAKIYHALDHAGSG